MAAAPDTISELLLPPLSPTQAPRRLHALDERETVLALAVDGAERALAAKDHDRAIALLEHAGAAGESTPLALRALFAESWARMELGQIDGAVSLLTRARAIAERPGFTDVDRAEALYRLGCCRFAVSAIAPAISLLSVALELCDRTILPCDRLRADILERRSRCYQRQRDWAAARADVERGLELAQALGEERRIALLLFQASIVAERERQWLLARFYAEEAKERLERLGDAFTAGRVLNNLAGIAFLLGEVEEAKRCALEAHEVGIRTGDDLAAGYALSSYAQILVRAGEPAEAEAAARSALELLDGRIDHLHELGNAQLVLARGLAAQRRDREADEAFAAAEASMAAVESAGHLAAVWIARGDALAARGDAGSAAAQYRRAAERLQDVHF